MAEKHGTSDGWSETQVGIANRIANLPRDEQAAELIKWALARIVFYGPSDEPCAECLREWQDEGGVKAREYNAAFYEDAKRKRARKGA